MFLDRADFYASDEDYAAYIEMINGQAFQTDYCSSQLFSQQSEDEYKRFWHLSLLASRY